MCEGSAMASGYNEPKSITVKMKRFPAAVVGKGPTISIATFSKGSKITGRGNNVAGFFLSKFNKSFITIIV